MERILTKRQYASTLFYLWKQYVQFRGEMNLHFASWTLLLMITTPKIGVRIRLGILSMVVIIVNKLLAKCIGRRGSRLWHPWRLTFGGRLCGFVLSLEVVVSFYLQHFFYDMMKRLYAGLLFVSRTTWEVKEVLSRISDKPIWMTYFWCRWYYSFFTVKFGISMESLT